MNRPEVDEVLRKIGRNVLNLQRIEAMLKYLVSRSSLRGDLESLKTNHENAVNAVSQQTMGNLVKRFIESIYAESGLSERDDEQTKTAKYTFRFRVEATKEVVDATKAALEHIVLERNKLIHHMLVAFNHNSSESCRALSDQLDSQNDKIAIEYENLRTLVVTLRDGIIALNALE